MTNTKQGDELQAAIWRIANEVRGAVDGWDFKQFVLGPSTSNALSASLATRTRWNMLPHRWTTTRLPRTITTSPLARM